MSDPLAVLEAVGGLAGPVYRKHAASFGTCACSTCDIARTLWPRLAEAEASRNCLTSDVPSDPGSRAGEPTPTEGAP